MQNLFRIHGYSPLSPHEILECLSSGGDITDIRGDFVLHGGEGGAFLLSSFLSSIPYYYAVTLDGRLVHGGNAYDVARRASIKWKWNRRAMRSLALLGHTVSSDTLCEGVFRMPPASRLTLKDGKCVVQELPFRPFSWGSGGAEDDALAELKRAFEACIDGEPEVHLSLSAGYDSRLLLALALDQGLKPHLSVMGFPNSTDVVVARHLADGLKLPVEVVQLNEADYLNAGAEIALVTSGVKTAINWHTYLYSRKVGGTGNVHLVGSNGEFARTFFFDYPRLAGVAERLPSSSVSAYWVARCWRRAVKFSRHNPIVGSRADAVREVVEAADVDDRWGAGDFLSALDVFYSGQRVRHFIGGGLACYSRFGKPRSPFLDPRWMRAVAALKRREKMRSAHHVMCTGRVHPWLSTVNYNELPHGGQGDGYHPFGALARSDLVKEMLTESHHLDQWASREERLACLSDPRCHQEEERNFWLTLHFAAEAQARAVSTEWSMAAREAC